MRQTLLLSLLCLFACVSAKFIDGQYIVVFHENITQEMKKLHFEIHEIEPLHSYQIGDSYHGYAARLTPRQVKKIARSEGVDFIEQDKVVYTQAACAQQPRVPSWGLNRISTKALVLDGNYKYSVEPTVDAYVIDSGIYVQHTDFGGRAMWGTNVIDTQNVDCNGHGTHVAGTIAGTKYGVAKNATLIAVKAMNCQGAGSDATIIAGVNWAVNSQKTRRRPSVINMSVGGDQSAALNRAVAATIKAGLVVVVAAGNSNADACLYSPASELTCITVAASTVGQSNRQQRDERASFSNWGTCVDIIAPGESITSAWIGGFNATMTISGTSMASPHVAGAAALYLAANPTATPAAVKLYFEQQSSLNIVTLSCTNTKCNSTPNRLLYSPCL